MIVSFLVALYFAFVHARTGLPALNEWQQLTFGVFFTTFCWILATYITQPTDRRVLYDFYQKVRPGGPGWSRIVREAEAAGHPIAGPEDRSWQVPLGILCMLLGSMAVYSTLFATGYWIYGNLGLASLLTALAVATTLILIRLWGRLIRKSKAIKVAR